MLKQEEIHLQGSDRVPRPGDLMLLSREAELYLCVCEGQMCIS